jgi:hypothetical protein
MSEADVRQYQAVRIWITGKRPKGGFRKWKLPSKVFGEKPMGRDRFSRLQKLWLSPEAAKIINSATQAVVQLPENIAIDEKLKLYSG